MKTIIGLFIKRKGEINGKPKDLNAMVKGISIINPDEVEKGYYIKCIKYAIKSGYNHIQITGPIHDVVKGNIDGMIFNRKYSVFNYEKDTDYVNNCIDAVNYGLEISAKAGIKTYMWHHELILPDALGTEYPEVLNDNGDIEVSHPTVKDYLENKIKDFFFYYPKMDGIILTLHETKIPLLKLKNQKLDKIERVKFVTEVLYKTCKELGKELIVRPFASIEEDQIMMLKAYEEISPEMLIMDKWTKFDWSLSLPDNDFFKKIKVNPFIIETDIFGEYFGKGRLPIMFKDHIENKFNYCNNFKHSGFVNRIDRNGQNPFDSVNEVNLVVMRALMKGEDVEKEVNGFFKERYKGAYKQVRDIMEKTEENQKKIFYLNGYYFTQGSLFPSVNQAKNHFWFEIMKENFEIKSNEWFIPVGWKRGTVEGLLKEKEDAETEAKELLREVERLKGKMPEVEYEKLLLKFKNLSFVASLWKQLTNAIYNYAKYFESKNTEFEKGLIDSVEKIREINAQGEKELGKEYYNHDHGKEFCDELLANFNAEKKEIESLERENLIDFIVCGGATEGHGLKKEVNFSDTLLSEGKICRIPGNKEGKKWSSINAHGWFSYEIKVKKNAINEIKVLLGSDSEKLDVKVTIDGISEEIRKEINGKEWLIFRYDNTDKKNIKIRFDKIADSVPFVFKVKVLCNRYSDFGKGYKNN